MFCPNCGTKIEDGVRFCPNCGAKIEEAILPPEDEDGKLGLLTPQKNQSWNTWMMTFLIIVSILIPLIGIIIGLVNKNKEGKEKQAKTILITSLVVIAINIILVAISR